MPAAARRPSRAPAPRSPAGAGPPPATRAPQLSSAGSGPISAPAPSTDDGAAGRAEPVGVRRDRADGVGARRLHTPSATQASSRRRSASPRSRPPWYGSDELASPPPAAGHLDGVERAGRRPSGPGRRAALPALGADHPHPLVQRAEAAAGHRQRGSPRPGRPRSAAGSAPGSPSASWSPARRPRARRVDRAQRVGDHRPAQRRGAPAPVRRGREDHPALLRLALLRPLRVGLALLRFGAHRHIMPEPRNGSSPAERGHLDVVEVGAEPRASHRHQTDPGVVAQVVRPRAAAHPARPSWLV